MRTHVARRAGLVTALLAIGLCAGVTAADAATPPGAASLGSANFSKPGTMVSVPTLGACSVSGPKTVTVGAVSKPGVIFGGGTSSCTITVVDPSRHLTTTKSQTTGRDFELSALVPKGGPRISIGSYQVSCTGSQRQTSAGWGASGLYGVKPLPAHMPANYTQQITNRRGKVLATAEFNIEDLPGDGSINLTMLRITFAPASGYSGSVTVGSAACTPTP